jgi:hypothetical protein
MQQFDLNTTLITFKDEFGVSEFTIGDSFENILCMGSNGSGKTSGSSRIFLEKFLQKGYGGIVLSAKSERTFWEECCKKTGVLDKLVIINPGSGHSFDFLEYELKHNQGSLPYTENIYQLLYTVLRSGNERSGKGSDDPFWSESLESLIIHSLDLCMLAYDSISIEKLYSIVLSAPKLESVNDGKSTKNAFAIAFEKAQNIVNKKIGALEASLSQQERTRIENSSELLEEMILKQIPEAFRLKMIDQFFIESYRMLSSKTRSIVDFSFTSFLNQFLREPFRSMFCNGKTTFSPEDCFNGKILLLDIPVKKFFKTGRDVQTLMKLIFQRAVERRTVTDNTRPLFIWSDECQFFITEQDSDFLSTSRSSRVCSVMITQNLPGLYSNMAGSKSEWRTKAFLAVMGTKIFNSNADVETNRFASETIGDGYIEDESQTSTVAGTFSSSKTKAFKLERMVRPEEFSGLKCGGKCNNYLVEAYIHLQNRLFHDGHSFRKVTFSQH